MIVSFYQAVHAGKSNVTHLCTAKLSLIHDKLLIFAYITFSEFFYIPPNTLYETLTKRSTNAIRCMCN